MKFTLKIKPQVITGYNKDNVLEKISRISNSGIVFGGSKHNLSYSNVQLTKDDKIIVYHLEKHRMKSSQLGKSGKKLKKSKIVKKGFWKAYVYKFDKDVLKACGVKKISQGIRNFKIEY